MQYPIDTVRRRMQLQGIGGRPLLYKNAVDCLMTMSKKEAVPEATLKVARVCAVQCLAWACPCRHRIAKFIW